MIPKTIHYLWLSDEKPQNIINCLNTWKEQLKGYEIKEWNKSNFPYSEFVWTREAFLVQKWAFVTDFFRLWVLKNCGGIYLDADVVVRNNFDSFLHHKMFIGTEGMRVLGAHAIGAEAGHPFIEKCLAYYENRHFTVNGKNDMMPIPNIITKIFMREYRHSGKIAAFDNKPVLFGNIAIYNDTFFNINIYNGFNVCYHNAVGSWRDKKEAPLVSFFTEMYFAEKYFTYGDVLKMKRVKKLILNILPFFLIAWYYNRAMKIKNNPRVKQVKL